MIGGLDDKTVLVIARQVCTDKQLQVVQLREAGKGWKASALILGIGPDTVRDHYRAAVLKILKEADRVQALRSSAAGQAPPAARGPGRDRAS